jgi:hypothetical protein
MKKASEFWSAMTVSAEVSGADLGIRASLLNGLPGVSPRHSVPEAPVRENAPDCASREVEGSEDRMGGVDGRRTSRGRKKG